MPNIKKKHPEEEIVTTTEKSQDKNKVVEKLRRSKKLKRNDHFNARVYIGSAIVVFSLYAILSMISYIICCFSFCNPGIDAEYHVWKYLISSVETCNFMGRLGDIVSILFIKKLFGISSFILLVAAFSAGIEMVLRRVIFKRKYMFFAAMFLTMLLSLTFALLISGTTVDSLLLDILPGYFGFLSLKFLHPYLGTVGLIIVLAVVFIVFLYFRYHFNVFRVFVKKDKNPDEIDEEQDDIFENKTNRKKNEVVDDENAKNNDSLHQQPDHEGDGFTLFHREKVVEDVTDDSRREVLVNEETEDSELLYNGDTDNTVSNNSGLDEGNRFKAPTSVDCLDGLVVRPEEETVPEKLIDEHITIDTAYDPTLDLPNYQMPYVSLLNDYDNGDSGISDNEIEQNRENIKNTLHNYSIEIQSIKATVGPTITLYEIIPAPGVRIAKIKNLEDDIALSLAAIGIRIIAPIPGRGTIGIEVPNSKPQVVSIKSVLSSKKFLDSTYELPVALGKTIQNETFVTDLTKMPHLLIAGATGQGKSVGLNAIVTSLLYKKHPSQLKFVMVDPKKVELPLYAKIERHYLAKLPDVEDAIITDTKLVVNTLNSLLLEMDARYNLLKLSGVRNIKEYNARFIARRLNPENGHRFLPYIVVVIDEFGDLIMTAGREVETPLTRLAQLARATGIHLIIATQRPSVNIITGTIKANFPARLAFRVVSKIDSRTILDSGGADQLIGRGDMLLSTGNDLIRMQCAFVDTDEVERLTEFIGDQSGYSSALMLPEYSGDSAESQVSGADIGDRDPLFAEAARLVVNCGNGSTSNIQRKMNLGYNRAGRIMDQLEAAGIVGPAMGSKPRELYVHDEIELNVLLENMR